MKDWYNKLMDKIEWRAPEFEYHERNILWYVGLIIITTALLMLSLWQENFLFAMVIILASTLIIIWSKKAAPIHTIAITERTISVGDLRVYPIGELQAFTIEESGQNDGDWGRILLQSNHRFRPIIKLLIPQAKLDQAREVLEKKLPQFAYEPSLADELIRWLKL